MFFWDIYVYNSQLKQGEVLCNLKTRPLCLLALFSLYGGYRGYHLDHIGRPEKYQPPICIMAEYLETNILDFRLPFKCEFLEVYAI